MKLVHWPMGGLLHLVQRGWEWAGRSPPRPLLAVPNVTSHPSTASVPITVLLYNAALLCGFNVAIRGLIQKYTLISCLCYDVNIQLTVILTSVWFAKLQWLIS